MSDFHFLLRHALTGVILLIFAWLGWWAIDPANAVHQFINGLGTDPSDRASKIITVLVAFPVIGIAIQGAHVGVLGILNRLFSDAARRLVATELRAAIRRDAHVYGLDVDLLDGSPDDAFFVALYHEYAPAHLIEWARRRRSYYYLGLNTAIAAALGAGGGVLYGLLKPDLPHLSLAARLALVVGATLAWCLSAAWLGLRMRQDVDAAEYVWTTVHLNAGLNRAIAKMCKPPA